jgi:PTS system nitrogen regulatory IIA component
MNLGVRDAAALLGVSEKTVYRWISQRRLPGYRVNQQYRFNRAELLEWATSQRLAVSPRLLGDDEDGAVPSVYEALRAGGIFYRIGGADKPTVLRNVVEVMQLGDDVDREFLLQVLLARETLGSTGIGDGLAIPHVRNPIVMHIPRPMMALCFLETPIDFAAIDGKPVHTLFTIVSPTIKAHLGLLSKLSFALRGGPFADAVHTRAARDELLQQARLLEPTQAPPAQSQATIS